MSQGNVEIVRGLYDALADGTATGASRFFAPDIEYGRLSDAGEAGGLTGTWHGLEGMAAAIREFTDMFDDFRVRAERFIDTGDEVVVFIRIACTAKGSGISLELESGDVLAVRDGLVARWHQYRHRSEALEAAGLPPEEGY